MSNQVLQPIVTKVDSALATYVNGFSSDLISAIAPLVQVGLVLYFIWVGIAYIKGFSDDTLSDIGWHIFRVGVIVAIAMQAGTYQSYIATPLQALPDDLANTLLNNGANGSGLVTLVDTILDKGIVLSTQYYSMIDFSPFQDMANGLSNAVGGIFSGGDATAGASESTTSGSQILAPLICGTAIIIGTVFCLIVGCFWYLATKFLISLLLGFGALFIVFLVWENTRAYFGAWLNAMLSLMIINLMVTACFTIFSDIFESRLEQLNTNAQAMADASQLPIGDAIGLGFMGVLVCATLLILPSIAIMLSQGGGAFGAMFGAVGSAVSQTVGAAKGAKATGSAAGKAYNKAGEAVGNAYHSASAKAYSGANAVANYFRK